MCEREGARERERERADVEVATINSDRAWHTDGEEKNPIKTWIFHYTLLSSLLEMIYY